MSPETIAVIADVAAVVLSAAAIALGFYIKATTADAIERRCEPITERCEELRKEFDAEIKGITNALYQRINGLGDRMQHVESRVDDAARRDDLHALSLQLAGIAGDLKAITARMESLDDSARLSGLAIKRVENHLFKIEA
jgi:hypothetical protein